MNDRKYLKPEQVTKLSEAWNHWFQEKPKVRAKHYWVWLVLLHTGARVTEALKLEDSNFLADDTSLRIRRLKLKDKKKVRYKTVKVSTSAFLNITLSRSFAVSSRQTAPTYLNFYFAFKHCCQLAGITDNKLAHPHAMRHSYATYLVDSGLDSAYVMQLLGHASITSTMVYLEKTADDLGKMLEAKNLLRP